MKKLLSIIALTTLLLLPSACSKSNEKAEELLKSVPKTTAGVGIINLERMANEAGVKKEGDKVVLPTAMMDLLGNEAEAKELLSSGALEMSVMAVYVDADAMCVTGFTSNPAKLSEICGEDVTVRDNRFWLTPSGRMSGRIADNAQALSADESFASTPYSSTLADLNDYDMRAIANIQGLLALSRDRQAQMAMGMLGSLGGAKYATYDLTSTKGKVEMELCVLNSDFEKVDTPKLPEINLKGIEKLHGRMEIVGAVAVDKKMMEAIAENLPNLLGGGLPVNDASRFFNLIGNIDGTIAMGGTLTEKSWQWELALPFASDKDAKEALSYANMLTEGMPTFTRQDDNVLFISNVNLNESFDGPQNLSSLKGQFIGVAAGQSLFTNPNLKLREPLPIKSASLTCGKKDGRQTLVITIETTGDKNGLFTLVEGMAKQ